ncbi:hypothetical protein NLJ89_g9506 [Agrocybe chaxingu]|uniref:Uncharacterized protein n=1 Tax=Agrocybe chaxingu TaxID=84603 RepID=A0A9W8MPT1_9AGAR|nr:hypothetical protein NLJ89_g9506 [Agrocybe chaxingu]
MDTPFQAHASTPAPPSPAANEQQPTRTSDPLQVAAQAYPWMFMSTTLDACFKSAETTATNEIDARTKELDEQEAGISDQRDRLEAERAIQFYDELGSDMFAKEVPAIMQLFHSHGDSCDKIEREALKLASRGSPDPNDEEPLKDYNNMLDDLESLQTQAADLSNSITKLTSQATPAADNATADDSTKTDESAARKQIISIFSACLPVLRARIANLSMAQELIDSALENASLSLRMESMGLAD